MRKEAGLELTDRIRIYHRSAGRLAKSIEHLASYIQQETLALEIRLIQGATADPVTLYDQEVNGEKTKVGLEKLQ